MTQAPSQPLALGTDVNHTMETGQQRGQQETSPHVVFSRRPSLAQSQTRLTGNGVLRLTAAHRSSAQRDEGSGLASCQQDAAGSAIALQCPVSSVLGINMDLLATPESSTEGFRISCLGSSCGRHSCP